MICCRRCARRLRGPDRCNRLATTTALPPRRPRADAVAHNPVSGARRPRPPPAPRTHRRLRVDVGRGAPARLLRRARRYVSRVRARRADEHTIRKSLERRPPAAENSRRGVIAACPSGAACVPTSSAGASGSDASQCLFVARGSCAQGALRTRRGELTVSAVPRWSVALRVHDEDHLFHKPLKRLTTALRRKPIYATTFRVKSRARPSPVALRSLPSVPRTDSIATCRSLSLSHPFSLLSHPCPN